MIKENPKISYRKISNECTNKLEKSQQPQRASKSTQNTSGILKRESQSQKEHKQLVWARFGREYGPKAARCSN